MFNDKERQNMEHNKNEACYTKMDNFHENSMCNMLKVIFIIQ